MSPSVIISEIDAVISNIIKCNAKLLDHTGTSNQSLHESLHSTCAFMFIDEDLLLKSKVGICNGFDILIAISIYMHIY